MIIPQTEVWPWLRGLKKLRITYAHEKFLELFCVLITYFTMLLKRSDFCKVFALAVVNAQDRDVFAAVMAGGDNVFSGEVLKAEEAVITGETGMYVKLIFNEKYIL